MRPPREEISKHPMSGSERQTPCLALLPDAVLRLQGLCEDACVLKWSGQPIGIGLIQRYIADWERKHRQPPVSIAQDTGKKVAVIGAGPAGLAGSALLRRYGHQVTIYEASSMPGRNRMVWGSRLSSA